MAMQLETIPCLTDNFAFLIHDRDSGQTACIDVPDAVPVLAALDRTGWRLTDILLTHHHADHVQGVAALRGATGARVLGAAADAHRLPPLDLALTTDMSFTIGREPARIIDVSGHTVGHIAFYFAGSGLVFTGDSLMAAGCGRLFEGTPAQMWASLCRLMALPPETLVCSGHDYLNGNLAFAASVDPANAALASRTRRLAQMRRDGLLPIPSLLSEELATNPFLRAALPELAAAAGQTGAAAVEVFTALRALKDGFR